MSGAAIVLSDVAGCRALADQRPVGDRLMALAGERHRQGSASKPSDVITAYGGTTVEIRQHTDAEGRIVLCDLALA